MVKLYRICADCGADQVGWTCWLCGSTRFIKAPQVVLKHKREQWEAAEKEIRMRRHD